MTTPHRTERTVFTAPPDLDDGPLAAATGIVIGVGLGLLSWLALVQLVRLVWPW
jgi:hypothetical protein